MKGLLPTHNFDEDTLLTEGVNGLVRLQCSVVILNELVETSPTSAIGFLQRLDGGR